MDLKVTFWGVRGSIPTPGDATRRFGGNTACVEIAVGDTLIVCDAGSGIRPLGLDLLRRHPHPLDVHLFLTHAHWDHIQGFPFFAPAYHSQNRIRIYGNGPSDDRHYQLLSGQMQGGYFPISFLSLKAAVVPAFLEEGRGHIGPVAVEAFPLNHPGGSTGYIFGVGGRKVVYATDHQIDWDGQSPERLRPVPQACLEAARGADLLIADAQFTDAAYLAHPDWGHSSAHTVTDWAVQAGVKQLALFHHDPSHSDEEMDALARSCAARAARLGGDLAVFAAEEGRQIAWTV
ncbi:MAG: MBL fold metallo-hydrolase [Candidatus Methylacidiphilales bacterium]|nr:MBL fold metallo-hydrolase [Candidatus Methylacidiphilales bacterium]